MRMRPSQSSVMKRKVGSTPAVEDLQRKAILLCDPRPVVDAGPAQGIDRELEGGPAQDLEVDDAGEVIDVGGDVVMTICFIGSKRSRIGDAFHILESGSDDLVGTIFDPFGGRGVRRSSVRTGCI